MMRNTHFALIALVLSVLVTVDSQTTTNAGDAAMMQLLKKSLIIPTSLDWLAQDPCQWAKVQCSGGRVTRIQIGKQGVSGSVPDVIKNLTSLQRFEVFGNSISGPLPSLSGLSLLESVLVNNNNFSSVPSDFFSGLSSLREVSLDNNPFKSWQIPESINGSGALQNFSANSANIGGSIPEVFSGDNFPNLVELHLAMNRLEGPLPKSFSGWSSLQSLWLNGLKGSGVTLNGSIEVLQTMNSLSEIWLNTNSFSGPIPDFSNLTSLTQLSLRDNQFTGPVPPSLVSMKTLKVVNLTNNMLQGPMPKFDPSVVVDMFPDTNSFCLPKPGGCDPRVNTLLSFAKNLGYPATFAEDWKGNDPCAGPWRGITCDNSGNITVVNFQKRGLTGTISPDLSQLQSSQEIILSNNNLYGPIPNELTSLKNLHVLDLSNNNLSGKVPSFKGNVRVNFDGNPNIGKNIFVPPSPGSPGPGSGSGSPPDVGPEKKKSSKIGVVVGLVVGVSAIVIVAALLSLCLWRKKQNRFGKVQSPNATLHPRHSGSGSDMVKITVAAPGPNAASSSEAFSHTSGDSSDVHVVEANHMVISIQVLRNVTNNFSEQNILGRGGFGTVYKGELHDGTKIAVKRMESGVLSEKGLNEFKSEIALVTKVRHRHLVNLVGYCLDGNERLLVYEYMPQGTLSRHLFHWKEEGLKPLEWTRRLAIALDVARGVEYLHNLAQQSYIHRDLKPSNILLDDDMRAKVADFGLARLAPNGKDYSIQTKLAGTFGYLAPEYAVTGRVTTKSDVFSFGVILMELITGRRALDENEPEESMHLVTWFKRMQVNKDTSKKAIDQTIDLTEETLANISIVAELAGHCCAREAQQRPDMSRVVNVLSSLAEQWKPVDPVSEEDIYGIDLEMTLPQALKRWQAFEGNSCVEGNSSSSLLPSGDNTQTSIPTRPSGFAESFRSEDGR